MVGESCVGLIWHFPLRKLKGGSVVLSPYFFVQNLRETYGLEVPPLIFRLFMRFFGLWLMPAVGIFIPIFVDLCRLLHRFSAIFVAQVYIA